MATDDSTVTLDLVGARLLALTADVRDLQQRFAGMECGLPRNALLRNGGANDRA